MDRPRDNSAPELDNSEQEDDDQAQDVAAEALAPGSDHFVDSVHGGHPNPAAITPDDVPDLIDKMEEMLVSGRIDNGAFEGEPMMDDEDDRYGRTDEESDDS
jgi:hypothetical protein